MVSVTKHNAPALRFDGFGDEWVTHAFSDLVDYRGHNSLSRAELTDVPTPAMNIHYGDILVKYDSVVDASHVDIPFVRHVDRLSNLSRQSLSDGDILFADAAEDSTVGKCVEVQGVSDKLVLAGLHTISARPNRAFAYAFLGYALNAPSFHNQLLSKMQGTKVSSISISTLTETDFSFPPEGEEQHAIGELFTDLDALIEQHRAKHANLQQTKTALMQRMFPQEGQTVPELRLEGFSGKWSEHNFLDLILKIIDFRGRTPKKLGMEWSEVGYLALSANNVKQGFIDLHRDAYFGDDALYSAWMSGNELHKGQVLFTTEAPMGNVAQVPDDRKYILSQRVIAFSVKPSLLNDDFLRVLLSSPVVSSHLESLTSGGTAKGVSQNSLSRLVVVIPESLEEQQAIGAVFTQLDTLIAAESQYIESLKQAKTALLQRMFI